MVLMQSIFLYVLICLIVFALARYFKDYALGYLAGILFVITGLSNFLNPISEISSMMNQGLATVLIGAGAYILIRGSLELINENRDI
jgi:hypothetical protein